MSNLNWDDEAKRTANMVHNEMFQATRGCVPWRDLTVSILFGNDGYNVQGGRPREVVDRLRATLKSRGIEELGFGVSDGEGDQAGYSWAMLVRSDEGDMLDALLWETWESVAVERAPGVSNIIRQANGHQRSIAQGVIDENRPQVRPSPN